MSERAPDVPEQVVQFAPKEKSPPNEGDALDQFGQAIIALLQQAANLSNQQCERAMDMAHKLGMQLRAAEDRIKHLQAERDRTPSSHRAGRAVADPGLPRNRGETHFSARRFSPNLAPIVPSEI
jgi:hypothetical protein